MFKKSVCLLPFFLLFFYSCSDSSKNDSLSDGDSLKYIAEKKYRETVWTSEIEGERLIKDISKIDTVEKNIKLTPQIFLNSSMSESLENLYPYLEGFSSLDTSSINSGIRQTLVLFCDALCKNSFEESAFFKDDVYELSLFVLDLKALWKKTFKAEFPRAKEGEEEEPPLFSEYITGAPYDFNSECAVPVRFVNFKNGFIDVMLYFSLTGSDWKIDQISIIKAEGVDGK